MRTYEFPHIHTRTRSPRNTRTSAHHHDHYCHQLLLLLCLPTPLMLRSSLLLLLFSVRHRKYGKGPGLCSCLPLSALEWPSTMTCGPAEHVAWEKDIRFRGCGAGGSPRNRVRGGRPSRRRRLARALASDATGTAVANDRAVTPLGDRPVVPEATGPAVADGMMGDASHPSSLREFFVDAVAQTCQRRLAQPSPMT